MVYRYTKYSVVDTKAAEDGIPIHHVCGDVFIRILLYGSVHARALVFYSRVKGEGIDKKKNKKMSKTRYFREYIKIFLYRHVRSRRRFGAETKKKKMLFVETGRRFSPIGTRTAVIFKYFTDSKNCSRVRIVREKCRPVLFFFF